MTVNEEEVLLPDSEVSEFGCLGMFVGVRTSSITALMFVAII